MRFSGNVLRFNKDEWSRPVSLEEFAVFVIYCLFVFWAKSCERETCAASRFSPTDLGELFNRTSGHTGVSPLPTQKTKPAFVCDFDAPAMAAARTFLRINIHKYL
jgi:hypothetical protein